MKNIINRIYQNQSIIYKVFLFVMVVFSIVYFFPRVKQFKYEFQKGKLWNYDPLMAPFDFAIQKSDQEIQAEKLKIKSTAKVFFTKNGYTQNQVKDRFLINFESYLKENFIIKSDKVKYYQEVVFALIDEVYQKGFVNLSEEDIVLETNIIYVKKGQEIREISYDDLIFSKDILSVINQGLDKKVDFEFKSILTNLLTDVLVPNVYFNKEYTQKEIEERLKRISYTKGKISENQLIINRGDVVTGQKLEVLKSLKQEYAQKKISSKNTWWILSGYLTLVSLAMGMLMLFLFLDRKPIYENNAHVTFIFLNVLFMVFLETYMVKQQTDFLYVVPMCIMPIVFKAFFDSRVAMFAHLLTVLLLGFIVPNSFEYIYLQTIAGFVTILTVQDIHKRGNLFIAIIRITLVYMLTYVAFYVIHEGTIKNIKSNYFVLFALNGVLSLLSVFFIWLYEKLFSLVSNITLLELSNTNSPLLRELNEKAPGTFQHSMQVANLAEAAAHEIGANVMLVRTGALYHDIGKISNPFYFIENQSTGVNPHHDLPPKESAKIIISHTIDGIELAKKHRLPDRVIDFIRTHHGNSLVYFFYKKALEQSDDDAVLEEDYRYTGILPFSKETCILMMCDATEAASKSLVNPTAEVIDDLVEKIIEKQKQEGQFLNANITLKEIENIKKVIQKKLKNIYQLRISYPD